MRRRSKLPLIITILLFVMLFGLTAFGDGEEAEYVSNMFGTFWALVPPIIAIVLALITKEVYSSLFIGIVAGALFYANFNPRMTVDTVVLGGFLGGLSDAWNAGIFMFLILLGIMVALINKAGGSAAFGRWAQTHIKTRTGALLTTFLLGVLIFIDDYFNCLTVGSVMRPVTDAHNISRSKLAYIIDATAAPICMIAPISSWAAAVSGMVDESVYSGIELFVRAIPYNFYSLLTIVFVIVLSITHADYGLMAVHEKNAENGDLFSGEKNLAADDMFEPNPKGKVIDLILPIIVLIICCVFGLVYVGGLLEGESFIDSFANTDASAGLPWGSMIAVVVTIIYLLCRRVISFKDAMACIPQGFIAMVPALLILTMAVTLKSITGMLGADEFVAGCMEGVAGGLQNMLPAVIFIVGCLLAFATGTSWGTFGILIPIVTALFAPTDPLLIISISACLAGAVCGDHCSPISDTTIMSSAGAQCNHVNHVSTQLPYAITVAVISFICFILAGFTRNVFICLALGIIIIIAMLLYIKSRNKKKA